jgi:hypothetical protein
MDWNSPWIAIRVFLVIIGFILVLIWAQATFKEPDPNKKRREEEAKRREQEAKRRQFRHR